MTSEIESTIKMVGRRAILVKVKVRSWAGKVVDRKITKAIAKERNISRDSGVYYKYLLPRAAMGEIKTVMSAVKNYFYRKTVVWTDNGERLLPIVMHEEFDEQMASFQEQLIAAKERFVKKYPDFVKQARLRLGDAFNEDDYMTAEEIMDRVGFTVTHLAVPEDDHLVADMADDAMEAVKESIRSEVYTRLKDGSVTLYERLLEVSQKAVEGIERYDSGESKRFYDSLILNVRETVADVRKLNVTLDPALFALADRIDRVLDGVNPDDLRKTKDDDPGSETRRSVKAGLQQEVDAMAGYMGGEA